jgi:hypothetical protein
MTPLARERENPHRLRWWYGNVFVLNNIADSSGREWSERDERREPWRWVLFSDVWVPHSFLQRECLGMR